MNDTLIAYLASDAYWPALAAGLLLATYVIRRMGADARLSAWLRPWIPIGLSAAAFLVAWITGAAGVAEAAAQSLAAAVTAIAGHDTGQAILALARSLLGKPPAPEPIEGPQEAKKAPGLPPLGNRMQRAIRARALVSGPLLVLLLPGLAMAAGCVTPSTQPMASHPGFSVRTEAAAETLAECRRMRDRSMWTAAGSAAAGALAGGLGAVALPVDRKRVELGLGLASALTAGVGAGLALLSSRYSSAQDEHCTPWPRPGAAAVPLPAEVPRGQAVAMPARLRQVGVPVLPASEVRAW